MAPRARYLSIALFALCAAAWNAPPAVAGPLEECIGETSDGVAAKVCLRRRLESVEVELADVRARVRTAAEAIDESEGRRQAEPRIDAARAAFVEYRDHACALEAALAYADADPGAWELACAIARTQARIGELSSLVAAVPDPVDADAPAPASSTRVSNADIIALETSHGATRSRDWTMTCLVDNGCTAFSSANDDDGRRTYIWRVARAAPDADWSLSLIALSGEPAPGAGVMARVDRRAATSLDARSWLAPGEADNVWTIGDEDVAAALLVHMRLGGRLNLTFNDVNGARRTPQFSLYGISAALALIEERQAPLDVAQN